MAAIKPLRLDTSGQAQAQTGEFIDIPNGGTGAITAPAARTALGLAISTNIQAWNAGLDAVAVLSAAAGTGFLTQTAVNTFAERTFAGSTRVSVTNPGGVAGNPTWDLTAYTDSGAGTFLKLTRDSQGLLSGTAAVTAADISGLINSTYLRTDGSASAMSAGFLTLFQDPTLPMHASTKQYVDNTAQGLKPKPTARAATTAALSPANTYANGASGVGATLTATGVGILTVDGVSTVLNDLVLVKNEATAANNGLYKVTTAGTAGVAYILTRVAEMDQAAEFTGAFIPVDNEGTLNKNSLWLNNFTSAFTVGATAVTFTQLNGATDLIAGNGITISGNTLSAALAARLAFSGGLIDLASGVATPGIYTKVTVDTYGNVTLGATATPSDVGAQPSSAELTALAALATTGLVARTATGTYVPRTIAVSGGIAGTNLDGVAGAPSLTLQTGVVTPGTYQSVTVDGTGRVTSGTTASSTFTSDNFTNGEVSAIAIGRAVYSSAADQVKLANANALGTKDVVGLVGAVSIASSAAGSIVADGFMAATTAQWDAVTGQSGGLTFGARYYLSNATAGGLTTTQPSSGYVAPVGIAMSTTKMRINIGTTILN